MQLVVCQQCGTQIAAADTLRHREIVCPKCGETIRLTGQSQSDDSPIDSSGTNVAFERVDVPEDVMDMTPMVDVVFQLLIFFMMTAAFSLQKSLELPPSSPQDPTAQSMTLEDLDNESDFIIVRIDHENNITVDGQDAPSEHELLSKLREAKGGIARTGQAARTGLLVLADPECRHETVVMVLDAGNAVGMERVRLATVEDTMF